MKFGSKSKIIVVTGSDIEEYSPFSIQEELHSILQISITFIQNLLSSQSTGISRTMQPKYLDLPDNFASETKFKKLHINVSLLIKGLTLQKETFKRRYFMYSTSPILLCQIIYLLMIYFLEIKLV